VPDLACPKGGYPSLELESAVVRPSPPARAGAERPEGACGREGPAPLRRAPPRGRIAWAGVTEQPLLTTGDTRGTHRSGEGRCSSFL